MKSDKVINYKERLRKEYLSLRNDMSEESVVEKSSIITEKLISSHLYKNARAIMTYIDFRKEVITRDIIKDAFLKGKRVIIPITDKTSKNLILSELKDFDSELCVGTYGVLEPKKDCIRKVELSVPDIILVPAAVFDERGYRIGYGGGYYDRFLSQEGIGATTIGLAYDFQVVREIPHEAFDVRMDLVIDDKGTLKSILS